MALLDNTGCEDYDYTDDYHDKILFAEPERTDLKLCGRQALVGEYQTECAHSLVKAGSYIEHIADQNDHKGAEHLEHAPPNRLGIDVKLFESGFKYGLEQDAYHNDESVPQAEADIFPVRAVPDSHYEEYYQRRYAGGKHL